MRHDGLKNHKQITVLKKIRMEKLNLLKKQNALVQEVPATRSKKKKKKIH